MFNWLEKVYNKLVAGIPLTAGTATIGSVQNVNKVPILSTIINAQSVAAGGNTGFVSLGLDGTESFVWLLVNIDKQPWSITAYNLIGGYSSINVYPQTTNKATAFANMSLPQHVLYIPIATGDWGPANISEALAMAGYTNSGQVRIVNSHATDNATITVRVLRVWR